jgi:hypothetical protein
MLLTITATAANAVAVPKSPAKNALIPNDATACAEGGDVQMSGSSRRTCCRFGLAIVEAMGEERKVLIKLLNAGVEIAPPCLQMGRVLSTAELSMSSICTGLTATAWPESSVTFHRPVSSTKALTVPCFSSWIELTPRS